jgi:integrase
MLKQRTHRVTGYVFVHDGKRGRTFYAKYRLPGRLDKNDDRSIRDVVYWASDGTPLYRQETKRLGLEWSGKGRPPAGYLTKKMAEAELQEILVDARRGTLAGMVKTGATFADAAEEWFRHGRDERGKRETAWKPSTTRDHRSVLNKHLIPAFGPRTIEAITTREIETWRSAQLESGKITRRTAEKVVAILHGIFERARRLHDGLSVNPVADVERLGVSYSGRIKFYSVEEVWALVRAAEAEREDSRSTAAERAQDGALFLTAAFSGLRMGELLALRWSDIDFTAETIRVEGSVDHRSGVGTPKSGHGRAVPMASEVATALARLGQREHFTDPDDFVFPNATGGYQDNSALRRRFKDAQTRAELEPLRFHDLRHTFGTIAISQPTVSTRQVQEWLGHADSRTTARYTHYASRAGEAKLLADAFKVEQPEVETVEMPANREEHTE